MKKCSCLLILSIFLFTIQAKSQSFEKGSKVVELGYNFTAYATEVTVTSSISFSGFNFTNTSSETDGALNGIVPIRFEYGVSDNFGLGAELRFANYFIDEDDTTDFTENVKSVDFGILANYHIIRSERNDMYIGLALGFSSVSWDYRGDYTNFNVNNGDSYFAGGTAKGSGTYLTLGLNDRIYFSDHIGMTVNLGYAILNYPGVEYEFSDEVKSAFNAINASVEQKFDWKLNGVQFGIGLVGKF